MANGPVRIKNAIVNTASEIHNDICFFLNPIRTFVMNILFRLFLISSMISPFEMANSTNGITL